MDDPDKPYVYQELATLPHELQRLLNEAFHIVWPSDLAAQPDLKAKIQGVFLFDRPVITTDFLDSMPGVKVIGGYGAGYDHVRVALCRARGVRVGTTPGVLSDTTADLAFTLLLSAARRVVEGNVIAKDKHTTAFDFNWFGFQVSGTTIGIIGMGRIGFEIARRAQGFSMKVLYHNRNQCSKDLEEEVEATYVSDLHDLLRQSDFVVLAVPGSKENFHMIGTAEFATMKKNAVFVNIGRGSAVDHDALGDSLEQGHLGAAGLDVTDPEPLPRNHPLLTMPNVTITPHCGSRTLHTGIKIVQMTIDNILAGIRGEQMPHEVTE